ncbi:multidrug MFS transporter [Erysipelotrichaceae bacterium]|nr:multidrug MFS transporter [Erysipelotrichaceae bacterium]
MIFILLGTQKVPFLRLIAELDALRKNGVISPSQKIIIQAGYTPVIESAGLEVYDFLTSELYDKLLDEAELVITHGGAGSIFDALNKNKKIIALSRCKAFGEHVDDHQAELVLALYSQGYLIGEPTLQESFTRLENYQFQKYYSNKTEIITRIKELIEEEK